MSYIYSELELITLIHIIPLIPAKHQKKREPKDKHRYCVSSVQSGQDQSTKPLDILLTNNQNIKLSTEPHAGLHNMGAHPGCQ